MLYIAIRRWWFLPLSYLPGEIVNHECDQNFYIPKFPKREGRLNCIQKLQKSSPQVHLPQIAFQLTTRGFSLLFYGKQVGGVEID